MKSAVLTKPMAMRNNRSAINDPFRRAPKFQARRNNHEHRQPMPPSHQMRYPVLFALLVAVVALLTLNFLMQI